MYDFSNEIYDYRLAGLWRFARSTGRLASALASPNKESPRGTNTLGHGPDHYMAYSRAAMVTLAQKAEKLLGARNECGADATISVATLSGAAFV